MDISNDCVVVRQAMYQHNRASFKLQATISFFKKVDKQ